MKLFLTGLLWVALSGWLTAQEEIVTAVDTIHRDGYYKDSGVSVAEPQRAVPYKARYQLLAEAGYGTSGDRNMNRFLKAEFINGFLLSPNFYMGIGTGIRLIMITNLVYFWESDYFSTPVVPIYADMRFFLSPGNLSPYLSLDAGYSFDVSFGVTGLGLLINPMAGLSFARHTNHPVHVGVGYNSQMINDYYDSDDLSRTDKSFGSLVFTAGVTF